MSRSFRHRAVTFEEVKGWFAEAVGGTRFHVPADDAIAETAARLTAYRPAAFDFPKSKATEYAKRFVKHLIAERDQLLAPYRDTPLDVQMTARLEEAGSAVEQFLDAFDIAAGSLTWHDHALFIDVLGRRAWRAEGAPAPKSHDPEGPRVRFAACVLGAWGIECGTDQVSDALRGKYGNRSLFGFELGGISDKKTAQD